MARLLSPTSRAVLELLRNSRKPLRIKDLPKLLAKSGIVFKAATHIYTYLYRLRERGYILIKGKKRRLYTRITQFAAFAFALRSPSQMLHFINTYHKYEQEPEFPQLAPLKDDDPLYVSYDIPEKKRAIRIMFSTILQRNGFMMLHQSMYYGGPEKKKWVLKIAEELGVKEYIAIGRFVFEYAPPLAGFASSDPA